MSELEAFKTMLNRAGIVFTERADPTDLRVTWKHRCVTILRIGERDSDVNVGYSGFYTELFWAADGQLLGIGAWE